MIRNSASEMAAKLAAGEVTSVALTQAHLDRIAAVDTDVHAFLYVDSVAYVPAVTQNVYTVIQPTFTTVEASNITVAGDTLTIVTNGDYISNVSCTFSFVILIDILVCLEKVSTESYPCTPYILISEYSSI